VEIYTREVEQEFDELMSRLGHVFFSESGFRNARNYLKGLLGPAARKNGWQLSESLGEETPYKIQQFIYRGRYSSDELRDELRTYVSEELGEEDGVVVIDDTGFIKQGKKSCGVKRQYSGTLGKVGNCQVGVFLTYASTKGHAPIDRRLYMPKDWMEDRERLKGAGAPEGLEFQTKPEMALGMIQEATAAGVPYRWVTGDCAYGDYREIRQWLETNEKRYVMCVSGKEYIWDNNNQISVADVLKGLPSDGWFEASCGDGSKGTKVYDWTAFEIESNMCQEGWKRVMLVRRSKSDETDIRAHICYAPKDTTDEKLVEVAGTRWTVETCFKEGKGGVGLDQYEVRGYDGWYKHITFACIALAFLTVLSSQSLDTKSIQQHNPSSSSLDEFKRGRNLRV
jgi:SRSO17 transposase